MIQMHFLRPAEGTKFLYVVDSYIWSVIQAGGADNVIHMDKKGTVWLVTGDLAELIVACAREQGVKESQLGFTSDEHEFLRENHGVVMWEDDRQKVDAEYYTDAFDAVKNFEEYIIADAIQSLAYDREVGQTYVQEDEA